MRGTIISVNRAIIRHILFMGVERKVAVLYTTLSICVLMSTNYKIPEVFVGPILFIALHTFFRFVSKKDEQIVELYARHNRYKQGYFPARASVMAPPEKVRPSILIGRKV